MESRVRRRCSGRLARPVTRSTDGLLKPPDGGFFYGGALWGSQLRLLLHLLVHQLMQGAPDYPAAHHDVNIPAMILASNDQALIAGTEVDQASRALAVYRQALRDTPEITAPSAVVWPQKPW